MSPPSIDLRRLRQLGPKSGQTHGILSRMQVETRLAMGFAAHFAAGVGGFGSVPVLSFCFCAPFVPEFICVDLSFTPRAVSCRRSYRLGLELLLILFPHRQPEWLSPGWPLSATSFSFAATLTWTLPCSWRATPCAEAILVSPASLLCWSCPDFERLDVDVLRTLGQTRSAL